MKVHIHMLILKIEYLILDILYLYLDIFSGTIEARGRGPDVYWTIGGDCGGGWRGCDTIATLLVTEEHGPPRDQHFTHPCECELEIQID